jgi:hypothetical protein
LYHYLENEDGKPVRRSTRDRSRPLEYWRGEKKTYSRQHQSLPTVGAVTAVECSSPPIA